MSDKTIKLNYGFVFTNHHIINSMKVRFVWVNNFSMPIGETWVDETGDSGILQWIRVHEYYRGNGLSLWMLRRLRDEYKTITTASFTSESEKLKGLFDWDESMGLWVMKKVFPELQEAEATA